MNFFESLAESLNMFENVACKDEAECLVLEEMEIGQIQVHASMVWIRVRGPFNQVRATEHVQLRLATTD
jgi:hypothetical protein